MIDTGLSSQYHNHLVTHKQVRCPWGGHMWMGWSRCRVNGMWSWERDVKRMITCEPGCGCVNWLAMFESGHVWVRCGFVNEVVTCERVRSNSGGGYAWTGRGGNSNQSIEDGKFRLNRYRTSIIITNRKCRGIVGQTDSYQVATLPQKGNLKLCKNCRTISLICHLIKVMLKIILQFDNTRSTEGWTATGRRRRLKQHKCQHHTSHWKSVLRGPKCTPVQWHLRR